MLFVTPKRTLDVIMLLRDDEVGLVEEGSQGTQACVVEVERGRRRIKMMEKKYVDAKKPNIVNGLSSQS